MGDLGRQGHLHPVGVGPDGSGWLASPIDNGPQGLVRLGDAPRRYLDGEVIASVDLAADGTVWVQAATGYAGGRIEVYAILPEAASAVAEALRTLLGAAGS